MAMTITIDAATPAINQIADQLKTALDEREISELCYFLSAPCAESDMCDRCSTVEEYKHDIEAAEAERDRYAKLNGQLMTRIAQVVEEGDDWKASRDSWKAIAEQMATDNCKYQERCKNLQTMIDSIIAMPEDAFDIATGRK
jgi:chromosome segregation ATPase